MIIPIRCMTCGKPIAHLWEGFKKRTESGEDAKTVLDDQGLKRYCCRALLLTHVDSHEEISKFNR